MLLWRISNHGDLTGAGGMLASARWHTAGRPVVYLAESPAGALLEIPVHLELDEDHQPGTYQLLKIEADDGVAFDRVDEDALSPDWTAKEADTQARGDAWLRSNTAALLRIPSAIVPETFNYLLNPRHSDVARIRVLQTRTHPFDSRLLTK